MTPLTLPEIQTVVGLLDVAVKAVGLQAFQNGGGATIDGILAKLQSMADAASVSAETDEPNEAE